MKRSVVVGGGITGLCCAYYLRQAGHDVTLIDREGFTEGCSYGNAGMITPSHFIPLAAPGVIWKGIKWMFDARSPFRIKFRWSPDLWRWAWLFARASSAEHVLRCRQPLHELFASSLALYRDLAAQWAIPLKNTGILMVYNTAAGQAEEHHVAEEALRLGLKVEDIPPALFTDYFGAQDLAALGAVHYLDDHITIPSVFMDTLRRVLIDQGVQLVHGEVEQWVNQGKQAEAVVLRSKEEIRGDHFVLCGGAWTPQLTQPLGYRLPLQAGKGYSITFDKSHFAVDYPFILTEAKVAATPLGHQFRFAGTMEVTGQDLSLNTTRLDAIKHSARRYFTQLDWSQIPDQANWAGLRPVTADGMPVVGRLPGTPNIYICSGHAMVGMGLAPISGKVIAGIIEGHHVLAAQVMSTLEPSRF